MKATSILLALLSLLALVGCQSTAPEPPKEPDSEGWKTAKAEIYRGLALRALRGGNPERTRRLLSEAVQFEPNDPDSLEILARLSLTSGKLIEAKSYAQWWLKLQPRSVSALCLNGIIEESLGHLEQAETLLQAAIKIDENNPQAYVDLHALYLNAEREDDAESLRAQIRTRFPNSHEALLDHASYLEAEGRWEEALRAFQTARQIRPSDMELAVRTGTAAILSENGQELEGLQHELPAHARLEQTSLALVLAALQLQGRNYEAALQELDLLQGEAANDAVVYILRGEILFSHHDLIGASNAFQKAIELDKGIARAHAGLARVHLSRGQVVGAMRALQRAVNLEPSNAVNRALLASCLAQRGDFRRAEEHLEVVQRSGDADLLVRAVCRRFPKLRVTPRGEK